VSKVGGKLADLGYLVTQDELDQTLEQFKEQFGEKPLSEKKPSRETDLGIIVAHNDDPTGTGTLFHCCLLDPLFICSSVLDQLFVYFPEDPKVGVKTIKEIYNKMQQQEITRAIVVVQTGMTPSAKSVSTAYNPNLFLPIQFIPILGYSRNVAEVRAGAVSRIRAYGEHYRTRVGP